MNYTNWIKFIMVLCLLQACNRRYDDSLKYKQRAYSVKLFTYDEKNSFLNDKPTFKYSAKDYRYFWIDVYINSVISNTETFAGWRANVTDDYYNKGKFSEQEYVQIHLHSAAARNAERFVLRHGLLIKSQECEHLFIMASNQKLETEDAYDDSQYIIYMTNKEGKWKLDFLSKESEFSGLPFTDIKKLQGLITTANK